MNPEQHSVPRPLPSPEKVSSNVTLDQFTAIQGHEIKVQRDIIDEMHQIQLILGGRIQELEGKISNEKIKRLLATGSREQLAKESQDIINELQRRIIASEQRCLRVMNRLKEVLLNNKKIQDLLLEKEAMIKQFEQEKQKTEEMLLDKDLALIEMSAKHDIEINEKESSLVAIETEKKKVENDLQVNKIVLRQMTGRYNKDVGLLKKKVNELEEEVVKAKRKPPTPDIEITEDGDIRANLSSVRISESPNAVVIEEPKKKQGFFSRMFSKVNRLFEDD
jgi:hypothetical protein